MLSLEKDVKIIFGEILLRLLSEKNISQKEFARTLNSNPSTINKYIKGTRFPEPLTLIRISELFNTTTDYLLGETLEQKGYSINNDDFLKLIINGTTIHIDKKKLTNFLEILSKTGFDLKQLEKPTI